MTYAGFRRQAPAMPRWMLKRLSQNKVFAAPVLGWVSNANLANTKPGQALILENFFPTTTGIQPRGGRQLLATIGTVPVERVFHYTSVSGDVLFAADATKIFDVTSPGSPTVPPTPAITGQSNGYYSTALFTTSGGTFLVVVNGANLLLLYDTVNGWVPITGTNTILLPYDGQTVNFVAGHTVTGGTSGATGLILRDTDLGATGTLQISAVTGAFVDNDVLTTGGFGTAVANLPIAAIAGAAITGLATSALSAVWIYKNRLFFIEGGTLNIRFLPVDSVGGALGQKALGGIFKRGGTLLYGATWSMDSGGGLQAYCVVGTTEGEIAIFQGSNPAGSAAGDFDLVGRYDISKPLGKNATMMAGADLLVLTEDGVVPVSAAIKKDEAALSLSAVSRQIQPDWQASVMARAGTPWEIAKWPSHSMAVISQPAATDGDTKFVLVVNLETGAWTKYTNWDARSLDVSADKLYFGTRHGEVWRGEVGGADGTETIYCTYVGHADHLGSPGTEKSVHSMRSSFITSQAFEPKLSCSVDYTIHVPAPPSVAVSTGDGWDLSLWDIGVWDAAVAAVGIKTRWVSIGVTGFAINPQLQLSSNSAAKLDVRLVALDLLYQAGAVMV